jgi:hypothetical protein
MYTSPDRIGQLARDHHHEMIAAADRRRQLRPERGLPRAERSRPAPRIPALTRRLVAAFARSTPARAS